MPESWQSIEHGLFFVYFPTVHMLFERDTAKVWREFHNPADYPERPNVSWLYQRYPMVTSEAGLLLKNMLV